MPLECWFEHGIRIGCNRKYLRLFCRFQEGALMRHIPSLLVSSSFIVAMCASSPVLAQPAPAAAASADQANTPPPPPADRTTGGTEPTVSNQTNASTDAAAADQSIVVTGIRRSLQSARNIRRNSEQIVDSVVAE